MLEQLTSKKIFGFFTLSLLAGGISILTNFWSLYIPSIIVILYSFILFQAQKKFYISLSAENKNSPYILGFLFTLIALLNLFLNLNTAVSDISESFANFLIPQTGTALGTTIVGLVCRYLILSYDPAHETQEKIWKQATEELKENAAAYKDAQNNLLKLIDDFVTTHREVLTHEQEASKQHLNFLNETSASLQKVSKEFPDHLSKLMAAFDQVNEKYNNLLNEDIPELFDSLSKESSFQLQKLNNDFMRVAKTAYAKMTNSLEGLESNIDTFNASFEDTFEKSSEFQQQIFEDSIKKINDFQDEKISKLTDNLDAINEKSERIHTQLSKFSGLINKGNELLENEIVHSSKNIMDNLGKVSEEVQSLNASIGKTTEELKGQNKSFEETFSQRMKILETEINQIDQIMDAFIEASKKRLY